ncbi:hypothetical protein HDF16_000128 [Granulicella aggregans]|uniref:Uncharacterized protein n=1 Tax=Granulicella aggregans TaxID=474949 RepID=A0A7W8E1S6_9BACT|nr:hypothetical protein [Granulicella aggregans]MBB5055459.1 hypothetical protein [Granulicella aggregans]
MADTIWSDLRTTLEEGEPVRYWGPFRGYTYGTFTLQELTADSITIIIPSGEPRKISKRNFEELAGMLDGYAAREVSGDEVKRRTGSSAYIFSLVQEIRSRRDRPQRTIGDLLLPKSRVFLKAEYGPVSQSWPAASFSDPQYAQQLAADMKVDQDLILFSGTQSEPTPKHYRGRLMCIFHVYPGPPIDSGLVVDPAALASFQDGNKNRFAHSLPASVAWGLPELPSARELLGDTYSHLGQGTSRQSYVEVPRERIARLNAVLITRIPIATPQLQEAGLLIPQDELDRQLNQILARLLARAQQSGAMQSRQAPLRIIEITKAQLRELWQRQQGLCRLCGASIPLDTINPLLLPSADRIDNDDGHYSLANTQLTHRACNLGRNIGSIEQFAEWLHLARQVHP